MQRTLGLIVACVALGAAAFSLAPSPAPQSDLQKEVERLRVEVAELKRKVGSTEAEVLRKELDDAKKKVEETVTFLNAQADSAAALVEALRDAEKKGFTFGINPESRVALLQGFQTFCDGLQKNVPGRKPTADGQ